MFQQAPRHAPTPPSEAPHDAQRRPLARHRRIELRVGARGAGLAARPPARPRPVARLDQLRVHRRPGQGLRGGRAGALGRRAVRGRDQEPARHAGRRCPHLDLDHRRPCPDHRQPADPGRPQGQAPGQPAAAPARGRQGQDAPAVRRAGGVPVVHQPGLPPRQPRPPRHLPAGPPRHAGRPRHRRGADPRHHHHRAPAGQPDRHAAGPRHRPRPEGSRHPPVEQAPPGRRLPARRAAGRGRRLPGLGRAACLDRHHPPPRAHLHRGRRVQPGGPRGADSAGAAGIRGARRHRASRHPQGQGLQGHRTRPGAAVRARP